MSSRRGIRSLVEEAWRARRRKGRDFAPEGPDKAPDWIKKAGVPSIPGTGFGPNNTRENACPSGEERDGLPRPLSGQTSGGLGEELADQFAIQFAIHQHVADRPGQDEGRLAATALLVVAQALK